MEPDVIVAGIDVGSRVIHAVVMRGDDVVALGSTAAAAYRARVAESLYDAVLRDAGVTRERVERVVATGVAGKRVAFADRTMTEVAAAAHGALRMVPSARTAIDVGAEEGRAVRIGPGGKMVDFAVTERCAAGAGTFVETMARALEITVEEMARISLDSKESISMNAQCAVFGESEVVSLIHAKTPKHDIARAVHDAIAGRIGSLARIVGPEKDIVLVGGLAQNAGFVDSLQRELSTPVIVPEYPDFAGALGAAVAAAEEGT
jgi:benzoyl-CoA reductase subunit D